jgi:pyruvate decarboxylase
VLRKLIDKVDSSKVRHPVKATSVVTSNKDLLKDRADKEESSSVITHDWLWPTVGNFLQPNDVIVTETGERLLQ